MRERGLFVLDLLRDDLRSREMIEIQPQDYESVQDFKNDIIDSFAADQGQPFGYDEFAFEALDGGSRIGTINGYRLYDWLYVEFLAVSQERRGERVGTRLLERAEELALEMDLEGVVIDTFRYQAPALYSSLGYVERMVVPGKLPERDRIYLTKPLAKG